MSLKLKVSCVCTLALLAVLVKAPIVLAQTTRIIGVSYTKSALFDIDTQTANPPIIVNAAVGYGDAKVGDYLAVGVFDLDDGDLVGGLGSANPQPCSSTTRFAGCIVPLTSAEGSENLQFSLDHPKGVWNLALIAALLDNDRDPISSSYSDYTFTTTVQTGLTLTVTVPSRVPVDVDGVNGSGGSVQLVLAAGYHTIFIPEIVPVDTATRLKFVGWSDGSVSTNRSIQLNHDISLSGDYVTQYLLRVISPVDVQGAGWYDSGVIITLSIKSKTQPMYGIIGVLGGKWIFQGWSENETEISRSPSVMLAVNSAQTIQVEWLADYTFPFAILASLAMLSVGAFYFAQGRVREKRGRPHRHTNRSGSGGRSRAESNSKGTRTSRHLA